MADLFDQLKSEGPVKKINSSPAKSVSSWQSNSTGTRELFKEKSEPKHSAIRRESVHSPTTVSSISKKTKTHKARSLSPPKYGANNIKSLKVKLERKKLEEFLTHPLEEHANNIRKKQEKIKDASKLPKTTPTKAQQKLFEPIVVGKKKSNAQILKQFNIKPCRVRIHREHFQKFSTELKSKKPDKKDAKSKNKRPAPLSQTTAESPPLKKGKHSVADNKNNKMKNNFFIKLNTSPSKMEKKLKSLSKTTSPSSEAFHNKIKNSKFNTTTPPTKFSRSQLLRSFGKRFFNVQVKIERCTHPLMLTFESNDRARRVQTKRNKSKNLSVSFREQVEIFGGSSDSDDSCDEDFCAIPNNRNNRKNNISHSTPISATPVVMPARLKKVENGKVVDDIELDPSLFVDPKTLFSNTPFSPGRKKRDHKSFSPLKDECSPSPRKEQLKLANEKIPPTGLRRLNIDEDDDEDDDCEYIVPIELPQRRTSRTSSNATLEDFTSTSMPLADSPVNFPSIFNDEGATDENNFVTNTNDAEINKYKEHSVINHEDGSNESFRSAKDNLENINEKNGDLQLELGTSKANEFDQLKQTNGNGCNETSGKHMSSLNTIDDISMNNFLEDSQTNEDDTHSKSFVDTLINETIDKLSKDIDKNTTYNHCSDAI